MMKEFSEKEKKEGIQEQVCPKNSAFVEQSKSHNREPTKHLGKCLVIFSTLLRGQQNPGTPVMRESVTK